MMVGVREGGEITWRGWGEQEKAKNDSRGEGEGGGREERGRGVKREGGGVEKYAKTSR